MDLHNSNENLTGVLIPLHSTENFKKSFAFSYTLILIYSIWPKIDGQPLQITEISGISSEGFCKNDSNQRHFWTIVRFQPCDNSLGKALHFSLAP